MLGGVHATLMCKQVFSEAPQIDVTVRGEGEHGEKLERAQTGLVGAGVGKVHQGPARRSGCDSEPGAGLQRTFYDLGKVGYWCPQTKYTVDFHIDESGKIAPAQTQN